MSKIFLNAEVISGLGEDTFWTWIARELGAEIETPKVINKTDIVLHYSTLGKPSFPQNSVTLLWELYPEMSLRLQENFRKKMKKIEQSFNARWATVPTAYSKAFYSTKTNILPIGVDGELFCQVSLEAKEILRKKLNLPSDKKIAIWSGANHVMKGPDLRDIFIANNPEIHVISITKENPVPQKDLARYMQASDFVLNTSRLVPIYMFEWECFSAGLPFLEAGGIEREFNPIAPRDFVEENSWTREKALVKWLEFLDKCRFELQND